MSACPSDRDIQSFLAEELTVDVQADVATHLEGCETCQERLEAFASDSGVKHWREMLETVDSGGQNARRVDLPGTLKPSQFVGPYKLLQQIGEGGMGTVWMAEQLEPVRRRVALKLIKPGHDTHQVVARFEAERQALSMMDHPNIAKVLDAGATDGGHPYFVMELVKGIPITDYCDRHKLTIRERLGLFVPACRAIQHAHQKGIIHRDIKPSNILVTLHDGVPTPKVIDFGLAKALDAQSLLTEKTMFTAFGQIVGTLQYMSPEQAEMNALDVDTRTDVYSLGVLLYELLTGTTPLDRKRMGSVALDEMLRVIRQEEAERPSSRVSSSLKTKVEISEQRKSEPRRLSQLLRRDLDWIAVKALEKDRTRRYETPGALAQDVQRYLDKEMIEARPPSAGYRLSKAIQKHRAAFTTSALILLTLVTGLVVSSRLAIWALKAEQEANEAATEATQASELARRGELAAREQALRTAIATGTGLLDSGDEMGALPWFAEALRLEQEEEASEIHRVRLKASFVRALKPARLMPFDEPVADCCFANRDQHIVSVSEKGTVSITTALTGRVIFNQQLFRGPARLIPLAEGEYCLLYDDESVYWFDSNTQVPKFEKVALGGAPFHVIAPSPSEGSVLIVEEDRRVYRFRPGFKPPEKLLDATEAYHSVTLSPDASRLATLRDHQVTIHSIKDGFEQDRFEITLPNANRMRFSHDGRWLVLVSDDHGAVVRDLQTGNELQPRFHHGQRINFARFSHDSQRLLTATQDGFAGVWRLPDGSLEASLRHPLPVHSVELGPRNQFLVSACSGGSIGGELRIWKVRSTPNEKAMSFHQDPHPVRFGGEISRVRFRADGNYVLASSRVGEVGLWHVPIDNLGIQLPLEDDSVATITLQRPVSDIGVEFDSSAGDPESKSRQNVFQETHVLAGGKDGVITLHDFRTGKPRLWLRHQNAVLKKKYGPDEASRRQALASSPSKITRVQMSLDGDFVAAVGSRGWLSVWIPTSSLRDPDPIPLAGPARDLTVTADSQYVAVAYGSDERNVGGVQIFRIVRVQLPPDDRTSPTLEIQPVDQWLHNQVVTEVVPSSDSQTFAFRDQSGDVYVRGLGETAARKLEHESAVTRVLFSPKGDVLVTTDTAGVAHIWDCQTDAITSVAIAKHYEAITQLTFSPNAKVFATVSRDWTARVWDLEGQPVTPPIHHRSPVNAIAISDDGTMVVTGDQRGDVRVWDAHTGDPVTPRIHHDESIRAVLFSPDRDAVVALTAAGNVWLWGLPQAYESTEKLIAVANLLSGHKIESGFLVPDADRDAKSYLKKARKIGLIPSNPFGIEDVPFGIEERRLMADYSQTVKPTNTDAEENAIPWATAWATDDEGLTGRWASRWNNQSGDPWISGLAEVVFIDDRLFALYDGGGKYLIEAKLTAPNRYEGRYINVNNYYAMSNTDTNPWVGIVVDNNRIDGYWGQYFEDNKMWLQGRWDFRRNTPQEYLSWSRANEHVAHRRHQQALESFDALLQRSPEIVHYKLLRGRLRAEVGDAVGAAEDLADYHSEHPRSLQVAYDLVVLNARRKASKDFQKSVSAILDLVTSSPQVGQEDLLGVISLCTLANPIESDLARMEEIVSQWEIHYPENAILLDLRARFALRRGRVKEAITQWNACEDLLGDRQPSIYLCLMRAIAASRIGDRELFVASADGAERRWQELISSRQGDLSWQTRLRIETLTAEAGVTLSAVSENPALGEAL